MRRLASETVANKIYIEDLNLQRVEYPVAQITVISKYSLKSLDKEIVLKEVPAPAEGRASAWV